MSRTDKTRPWWVKAREHPEEHHDHTTGICELEADPLHEWEPKSPHQCYIHAQTWRPEFRCGCLLCRGDTAQDRRRERRQGKRQAHDWQRA